MPINEQAERHLIETSGMHAKMIAMFYTTLRGNGMDAGPALVCTIVRQFTNELGPSMSALRDLFNRTQPQTPPRPTP